MRVGYVSDERFVAIAGVALEFDRAGVTLATATSSARGAVDVDLEPGPYRVTLARDGFGSKTVLAHLDPHRPYQFRLLSTRLLGYAWPKWVKSGDTSEFKVHSHEPFKLSLWRYGWEKELIQPLGWFDEHGPLAMQQWTPDGDYTQTGVEWNRHGWGSPNHTQVAVAPERSGLYYFHAEGESGEFFSFPWVVAPRTPSASIAVLASTNTWNAYNNFGGRSNYINAEGLPSTPIVNGRLELDRYRGGSYPAWKFPDGEYKPLSFERPEPCNHVPKHARVTHTIPGRQQCHLAPAEWRLLGWMEREGFPYDFYAEAQLHYGELPLDNYRVLISQVHPEYWSRGMYTQVKDWVFERGGRFMYLAGNGLNCEVDFLDPSTLRFHTQLLKAPDREAVLDPRRPGSYFESRLHRTFESEANLLGVVFDDRGIMTAAPYQVVEPEHWVFAGTNLRLGETFGENSLHERIPGGASGHETDKRSASSPSNTVLLAQGLNPGGGGAEMVIHEPEGGGAVFSVGSITWTPSLLVDEGVSQITRNVLERFTATEGER